MGSSSGKLSSFFIYQTLLNENYFQASSVDMSLQNETEQQSDEEDEEI
jgi:hypothetical protein